MFDSPNSDFSFSGLKTAVLRLTKELGPQKTKKLRSAIAAEFQNAVVDVLVTKTLRAAKKYKVKTVMISGGVAANSCLRKEFELKTQYLQPQTNFLVPSKNLCTDNATMIGAAAVFHFLKREKQNWRKIQAQADLELR